MFERIPKLVLLVSLAALFAGPAKTQTVSSGDTRRFRTPRQRRFRSTARFGFRSFIVLTLLSLATSVLWRAPPAAAYEGEVHYVWTFYLALHAGFTERQAFQIGSATQAIDFDSNTGPMEATGWDAALGADVALFNDPKRTRAANQARDELLAFLRSQQLSPPAGKMKAEWWMAGNKWKNWTFSRPRIQNVWSRFHAFAEVELTRSTLPYQEKYKPPSEWLKFIREYQDKRKRLGEARRNAEEKRLAATEAFNKIRREEEDLRNSGTTVMGRPGNQSVSRREWKELLAKYDDYRRDIVVLTGEISRDQQRADELARRIKWEELKEGAQRSGVGIFANRALAGYFGSHRFDGVKISPEARQVRRNNARLLWGVGLQERNPGSFFHFIGDSFSHHDYDNVRGHATIGHHPDIMSSNAVKSIRMTIKVLQQLCRYRNAMMGAVETNNLARSFEPTELCRTLQRKAGRHLESPIYQGGDETLTRKEIRGLGQDPHIARVLKALRGMMAVNPMPHYFFNRAWGQITEAVEGKVKGLAGDNGVAAIFRDIGLGNFELPKWLLGQSNQYASAGYIRDVLAEDYLSGLLPAQTDGNLERRWGVPPMGRKFKLGRGQDAPSQMLATGAVGVIWPEVMPPDHNMEFIYDSDGYVVMHNSGPNRRFRREFALTEPYDPTGASKMRPPRSLMATKPSKAELARLHDHPTNKYSLEIVRLEVNKEVQARLKRVKTKTEVQARPNHGKKDTDVPMVHVSVRYSVKGVKGLDGFIPAIVGCWLDSDPLIPDSDRLDNPYGHFVKNKRFGSEWGRNGKGSDWGNRIVSRAISANGEFWERLVIPLKSDQVRSGAKGTCMVHLYQAKPVEVDFTTVEDEQPSGPVLNVGIFGGAGVWPSKTQRRAP